MQDGEFKSCPYCEEQIRASAIKCRYCGEWLKEQSESSIAQPIEERADAKATELAEASSAPQFPPDNKLTSGTEPDADSSLPPAAEDEPTATAPAEQKPPKRSNYFLRHWRGELSLGVSYWANGFLANLFLVVVVGAGVALQETASQPPAQQPPTDVHRCRPVVKSFSSPT